MAKRTTVSKVKFQAASRFTTPALANLQAVQELLALLSTGSTQLSIPERRALSAHAFNTLICAQDLIGSALAVLIEQEREP